jgi:hypothetical protein
MAEAESNIPLTTAQKTNLDIFITSFDRQKKLQPDQSRSVSCTAKPMLLASAS